MSISKILIGVSCIVIMTFTYPCDHKYFDKKCPVCKDKLKEIIHEVLDGN